MGGGLPPRWLSSGGSRRHVQQWPVQGHPEARRRLLLNGLARPGPEVSSSFAFSMDYHYSFSLRYSRYVALKILVSEISGSTTELQVLRHITQVAPVNGTPHITRVLDEFEHCGPNGVHKCLAFEPMGPSVNTMVEELPQFKPRKRGMKVRYPPWMAKRILKQSLQGLAFLHENGIAHGDFQPGNMLFTLNNTIDSTPEGVLRQEEDVQARWISPPVHRLDGKEDKWAPRYLCLVQSLVPWTCYTEGFKVKLSDMGGGESLPFLIICLYLYLTVDSVFLYRPANKARYSSRPSTTGVDSYRSCEQYR